jgi:hypothetical protein
VAAAGEAAERILRSGAVLGAGGDGAEPEPPASGDGAEDGAARHARVLLPAVTGSAVRHALDRDALGPRLVTVDPPPGHSDRHAGADGDG